MPGYSDTKMNPHPTNTQNPVSFPSTTVIKDLLQDFVVFDASTVVTTPEQLHQLVEQTVLECVLALQHPQTPLSWPNLVWAQQQLLNHFQLEPLNA